MMAVGGEGGGRRGFAFYIEALLLVLFLLVSMMVLIQMFSSSRNMEQRAHQLTRAVIMAQNAAEEFASGEISQEYTTFYFDEHGKEAEALFETGYQLKVYVEKEETGSFNRATIEVERFGAVIYALETARFDR